MTDESAAVIPASNKAAFFGYGVYESLRVFRGKIFYADWHIRRFEESAKAIGIELPYSRQELIVMAEALVAENMLTDALLRLIYYGPTEKEAGILVGFPMGFHFYADKAYSRGLTAITYPCERMLPQAKTLNLLGGFLALREAGKNECIEALLVNRKNQVTEGTRSNVFIVNAGGELLTPPKSQVLEGITRKVILENLPPGLVAKEREISVDELCSAKEAFATSTVFGVMPLVTIDGKTVGDGKPGKVTRELTALYDAQVAKYCEKQA